MKKILLLGMAVITALIFSMTFAHATPQRGSDCLSCHNAAQKDVNASYHANLGLGTGLGMYEKWCALPNFNLAEEGHDAWVAKCGNCHIGGGIDVAKPIDCILCHDINDPDGQVTVDSCTASCHGPKDMEKRGDVYNAQNDVHIARGEKCQYCHEVRKHNFNKGDVIDTTEPTNVETMTVCTDCHSNGPHVDTRYNEHCDKVACETCHTSTRPSAALASRVWNQFTADGKPITTSRAAGWVPTHKWYLTGSDEGHLPILDYTSQMDLPGAKITPFNAVTVTWFIKSSSGPIDNNIIVADVKAADVNGDRITTVDEMRNYPAGAAQYPDAALVTRDVNFQISHNITRDFAFQCNDCHGATNWVINWTQLGYPGDPAAGGEGKIYVADITMSGRVAGTNKNAYACITVKDDNGSPIEGVTVSGHWSGATSDTDSGTTDVSGKVTLASDKVKSSSTITFTFTVDDLSLSGFTYDSSMNVETSDSIDL